MERVMMVTDDDGKDEELEMADMRKRLAGGAGDDVIR